MEVFPAHVSANIDALDHSDDGSLALASSSLSGRFWTGSLWIFQDASMAPTASYCSSSSPTEAGTTDLIWVDSKRLLLASDTGSVDLWFLSDSTVVLENIASFFEHDSTASSISVNCDNTKFVSGSWDNRVKVWDLEKETCESSFYGHIAEVFSVSYHPSEPEIFLSCSKDGCVVLWDRRKAKPARTVLDHRTQGSVPTYIAWNPDSTNTFAVGFEDGGVLLKDTKSKDSVILMYHPHKRSVNRLRFSPKCAHWLASASDDCRVHIQDVATNNTVYTDKSHSDFVRGLSWDPVGNVLRSCGWDMEVKTHQVDVYINGDVNQSLEKEKIVNMDIDQIDIQSNES